MILSLRLHCAIAGYPAGILSYIVRDLVQPKRSIKRPWWSA